MANVDVSWTRLRTAAPASGIDASWSSFRLPAPELQQPDVHLSWTRLNTGAVPEGTAGVDWAWSQLRTTGQFTPKFVRWNGTDWAPVVRKRWNGTTWAPLVRRRMVGAAPPDPAQVGLSYTKLSISESNVTTGPRDHLVLGTYVPDGATTGIYPDPKGEPRKVVTSFTPQSNATYENYEFRTLITLTGLSNVTFINCWFRGGTTAPTSSTSLVRAWTVHGGGHKMIDCTFSPQAPHYFLNGINGHGFTLIRPDISGVVDGVGIFNTNNRDGAMNVTVEGAYIHDQLYWKNPPDTTSFDGSHCDGFQIQGGSNITIRYNFVTGILDPSITSGQFNTPHINACIMLKPDVGLITNTLIEHNWFYGANIGVNCAHDDPDRYLGNFGIFRNNRFGRNQRGQGSGGDNTWTLTLPSTATPTLSGNVYDDTGTPITIRRSAG